MSRRTSLAFLSLPLTFAFLVGSIVWAQSQEEAPAAEQPAVPVDQPVVEQPPVEMPAPLIPPVEEVVPPLTPSVPSQSQGPQTFTISGQVTAVDAADRRLTIALDQVDRQNRDLGASASLLVTEAARLIGPAAVHQFSGIVVGANVTAFGQVEAGALVAETVIVRLPQSGDGRPEWLRRIRVMPHPAE